MRCVLLDLDGTLSDPFIGISRCVIHALEGMGLPLPGDDDLRGWIGPPLPDSFSAWFARHGLSADPRAALARYRARYGERGWRENRVYPGVADALEALSRSGLRLLLATSKPQVYAARIVEHFGLARWLHSVHGSELDGRRSDKVELLAHVIRTEQLDPGACLMIGDREHDMRAARYHALFAAGALWGFGSARELRAAGAHWLLRRPRDMPVLVHRLMGEAKP